MCASFNWVSSSTIRTANRRLIHKSNLDFAAIVLLSGNNYYKIHHFWVWNLFHQPHILLFNDFLSPVISDFYYRAMVSCTIYLCHHESCYNFPLLPKNDTLQKHSQLSVVILSSDGRCDSLGKCAKFCTYTLMETS